MEEGGGWVGGVWRRETEQSFTKVESQSLFTRPAVICLENVTVLSGGGGGVTFHFTSDLLLDQG